MPELIRWPAEAIWERVAPRLAGFSVEIVPLIDSTNTELMRRARAGQLEPSLLVAQGQTAGRPESGAKPASGDWPEVARRSVVAWAQTGRHSDRDGKL